MEVRKEVLYFGSLPFASSLPHVDSCTSLHWLLRKLLQKCHHPTATASFVDLPVLASLLEIPENFAKVLADTLTAVAPEGHDVRQSGSVDVHGVVLFLFAQLYIRQSQRADVKDIWPANSTENFSMQMEPSSPVRMSTKTAGIWPTNVVRQQLQQQMSLQQQILSGFTEYIQRHAVDVLLLCLDNPPSSHSNLPEIEIAPYEFDRLTLLLQPPKGEKAPLSELEPTLGGKGVAPLLSVSAWVTLQMEQQGSRPDTPSTSQTSEIKGVCKNTVAKGQSAFPTGKLRILDCHDATIYALAPLQCVALSCCSDCTVVLGAVGKLVRVERCMRLQLICSCKRIYINASHDCIFYLGVNEQPILLGDNRFVQFAPYNTNYEHLGAHMEEAGVASVPNFWNAPTLLIPDVSNSGHADLLRSPHGKEEAPHKQSQYTILPPEKLMPFVVPFKGGPGRLCGGAATSAALMRSDSIGATVISSSSINNGVHMFPLPSEYERAVNSKVESVARLRAAVKSANLAEEKKREVQNVIQAYFREWLNSSGKMRQIYDLARLEKDADALT